MPEKATYIVNGTTYDIPLDKQDAFLKKYPNAEQRESFVVGKDTFDIPVDKIDTFKQKYPDAQPTFFAKEGESDAQPTFEKKKTTPFKPISEVVSQATGAGGEDYQTQVPLKHPDTTEKASNKAQEPLSPESNATTPLDTESGSETPKLQRAPLPASSYSRVDNATMSLGEFFSSRGATPSELGFNSAISKDLMLQPQEAAVYDQYLAANRAAGVENIEEDYEANNIFEDNARQRELASMDDKSLKREWAATVLDQSVLGKVIKPVVHDIASLLESASSGEPMAPRPERKEERVRTDELAGMAGQAYDPNLVERVSLGTLAIMTDLPIFKGIGLAFKAPSALFGRLVAAGIPARIATPAVVNATKAIASSSPQMAGTLGGHSFLADITEQTVNQGKSWNEIDWGSVAKHTGVSAGTGALVGPVGSSFKVLTSSPAMNKVVDNQIANRLIKDGVKVSGIVTEGTVFAYGDAIFDRESKLKDVTGENVLESILTIGALHLAHASPKSQYKGRERFVPREVEQMTKHLPKDRNISELTVEKDKSSIEKIVNDKDIAWSTKAKLLEQTNGISPEAWMPVTREVESVRTNEGWMVIPRDAQGNKIAEHTTKSHKEAVKIHEQYAETIRETAALEKASNMDMDASMKVYETLLEKGYKDGLANESIENALSVPAEFRSAREKGRVADFIEAVNAVKEATGVKESPKTSEKAPEKPSEPLSTKSDTKVPPKTESASEASKTQPTEARVRELMNEYNKPETTAERKTEIGETFANEYMKDATVSSAEKSRMAKEKLASGEFAELQNLMARPADKIAEIPKPTESLTENKQSLEAVNERIKQRSEELQSAKTESDKLLIGNEVNELRTAKRKLERKIEKQDVQEPSTEKPPVEDKPKVSEKARETDVKEPTTKATEKGDSKVTSIAEAAKEGFSISSKGFNAQVENLKSKLAETKADAKAQKQLMDGFIKANRAKIDAAGLSASEVRAINNAKTRNQVDRAMQKVTAKLEKPTPKMRAAAMEDFIKGNKGLFEGVRPRAVEAMLKKVNRASESDIMLDKARSYIEEVLTKKEAKDRANQKAKAEEDILKVTGPKAILEKGGRGGRKRSVKDALKSSDKEIAETLIELGEFVESGRSKRTPNPALEKDRVNREINDLLESTEMNRETALKIESLKERLIELDFANTERLSPEQVETLRDYARDLNKHGREKSREEKIKRVEEYDRLTQLAKEDILGDRPVPTRVSIPKQTRWWDFWVDTSWPSLLSKLSKYGKQTGGRMPFSNPMNKELTQGLVNPSQTKLTEYDMRNKKEVNSALKDNFGGELKGLKRMVDLQSTQEKTGVFIETPGGKKVELPLSEMQAVEKLLQLRDAEWAETLTRPLKEGGNGFTKETITQLEKFVSPEAMKFGEWMYRNQKVWGREVYNPVYRRLEGIDMANFEEGYWIGAKDSTSPYAKEMVGQKSPSGITTNRAIQRTGAKAPLKYTDAFETYLQYINEASRYAAWAESHKTLSYVFRNPSVKNAITQTHGSRAYEQVDYFLNKFAGHSQRQSLDFLDYMTNASTGSILALKTMVGIKQTLSSMYYGIDMPKAKLVGGIMAALTPGTTQYKVSSWLYKDPFVVNRRDAFMHRDVSSPMRFSHVIDSGSSFKRDLRRAFIKAKLPLQHVAKKAGHEIQGVFIRLGDQTPITKAGSAFLMHKYQGYAGKKLTNKALADHISGKKIDPSLDKAKADWLFVSEMTQQSTRESNVSKFRSSHSMARAATQFTSGPAQIWRVEQDALRKFEKARRNGDKKGMAYAVDAFVLTHFVGGFMFGLADNRFKVNEDTIEDILWSTALGNVKGVALLGRFPAFMKDLATGKPWAEATLKDMPSVDLLYQAGENAVKIAKELASPEQDKPLIKSESAEMLLNIAMANGIGIEGALNLYKGAKKVAEGESENPFSDIMGWSNAYTEDVDRRLEERVMDQLFRGIGIEMDGKMTVDREHLEKWMKVASDAGHDPLRYVDRTLKKGIRRSYEVEFGKIETRKEYDKRLQEAEQKDDQFAVGKLRSLYPEYAPEDEQAEPWDPALFEEAVDYVMESLDVYDEWYKERASEQDDNN